MATAASQDAWIDRLSLISFAIFIAALAATSVLFPITNYDMIPYAGLVGERPGMSDAAVHQQAYASVQAAVPPEKFAKLTLQNEYARRQYTDVEAFSKELTMYRVKIGYIGLGRLLGLAMTPISALRWINALSLAVVGFVSISWMRRAKFEQAALFVAAAWLATQLLQISQAVIPDLLTAACLLAGLALLRTNRWLFAAIAFGAATLVRADSVIFPVAFLAIALVTRTCVKAAVAAFALSFAAYLATTIGYHHPGWWAHFSFSILGGSVYNPPPFSVLTYARGVASALVKISSEAWPWLAVMCLGGWLLMYRRWEEADAIFAGLLLSLALRLLIFPLPEERFYLPTMMMLVMLVAERWSPRFNSIASGSRTTP